MFHKMPLLPGALFPGALVADPAARDVPAPPATPRDARLAVLRGEAAAHLRAGDADREAVIDLLGDALAMGYLDHGEFEQRTDRALRAATLGDLRGLTTDLPVDRIRPPRSAPPFGAGTGVVVARRAVWLGFALVSAISLIVWVATAAVAGLYYFWPVWPILGTGLAAISHDRALRGMPTAERPNRGERT